MSRLDQTWPHRFHRDQQVVAPRRRAQPGGGLQPPACWRILSASRRTGQTQCVAGSPLMVSAGGAGKPSMRRRSLAARRGPAARQGHRDHRHARRLGREVDATDSSAARRPAALAPSSSHSTACHSRCSQSLSPSRLLLQPIHSRVHRQSVSRRQPSVARRLGVWLVRTCWRCGSPLAPRNALAYTRSCTRLRSRHC